ncbi:MAG: HD domain-containing protein [Phycisphaerales bacterium]|nr:HD domain-containing protein [Phycisphaerales bacterium]
MKRHVKQLILVCLAQLACVAVGLFVQHQFAVRSLDHAAKTVAWDVLASRGHNAAVAVEQWLAEDRDAEPAEMFRTLLGVVPRLIGGCVLLVDAEWRVLASSDSETVPVGQTVHWVSAPDRDTSDADADAGRLALRDGEHLALAFTLKHHDGRLVATRSLASIQANMATLRRPLPVMSVMTLVWTGALLTITLYMLLARFFDKIESERAKAESSGLRHIQSLVRTRDAVIFGLAKLADSRDPETGDHLERISRYASTLASALRQHPQYADQVNAAYVRLIAISSSLHDIGKVGIADQILRKPGRLTPEERSVMEQHAIIGGECLREIEQRLGSSNFLQMARDIAFAHHERWDGAGYPHGLKGEQIPLSARIVAVVDVYDALCSKRVYKPSLPHERCMEIIREGAGNHFDPQLVAIFAENESRFREIAMQYGGDTTPAEVVRTESTVSVAAAGRPESVPALAAENR